MCHVASMEEDAETRRLAWIAHYVANGQHDDARQLGWDGSQPVSQQQPHAPVQISRTEVAKQGIMQRASATHST